MHDNQLPECTEMFRQIRETLYEIRAAILGDKTDASKGLVVRVDRLEQDSQKARWVLRSVIVAVIGLIVRLLWEALEGGVK